VLFVLRTLIGPLKITFYKMRGIYNFLLSSLSLCNLSQDSNTFLYILRRDVTLFQIQYGFSHKLLIQSWFLKSLLGIILLYRTNVSMAATVGMVSGSFEKDSL